MRHSQELAFPHMCDRLEFVLARLSILKAVKVEISTRHEAHGGIVDLIEGHSR